MNVKILRVTGWILLFVAFLAWSPTIPADTNPAVRLRDEAIGWQILPEITKPYWHIMIPLAGLSLTSAIACFVVAKILSKSKN